MTPRLGYFNVMESKNALVSEDGEKFYRGLPITSMAVALPMVFMVQFFVPDFVFRGFSCTNSGCNTPNCFIDSDNSSKASSSKFFLG